MRQLLPALHQLSEEQDPRRPGRRGARLRRDQLTDDDDDRRRFAVVVVVVVLPARCSHPAPPPAPAAAAAARHDVIHAPADVSHDAIAPRQHQRTSAAVVVRRPRRVRRRGTLIHSSGTRQLCASSIGSICLFFSFNKLYANDVSSVSSLAFSLSVCLYTFLCYGS